MTSTPVLVEPLDKVEGPAVVVNPPFPLMTQAELDGIYDLPFTYKAHPRYKGKRIPALDDPILHMPAPGMLWGCSFCTIAAHQGRQITWRSQDSVLKETAALAAMEEFKGHLTDLGGRQYVCHAGKDLPCAACVPERPVCFRAYAKTWKLPTSLYWNCSKSRPGNCGH